MHAHTALCQMSIWASSTTWMNAWRDEWVTDALWDAQIECHVIREVQCGYLITIHELDMWRAARESRVLLTVRRVVDQRHESIQSLNTRQNNCFTIKDNISIQHWFIQFICESYKNKYITVSTKILCSTTVFNIDNNQKCFLSSILLWFLKIMWHWRLQ